MICKIVYFSEAEFPESCIIQTQDEFVTGDKVYINKDHTLIIEDLIENGDVFTILDGEKVLKLKLI